MKAELDQVNGVPVLKLTKGGGYGEKRQVFDLVLTHAQADLIRIQMGEPR